MSDSKKSAWDGYRRWRKFSWIIFPTLICLDIFSQVWPIFAILLIYGMYCGFKIQWFECPRCKESFFIYPKFPRFYWPAAKKCMNCGFPKWEEPSPKPARIEIYSIPKAQNPRPDPVTAERLRLAKFLTLVLRHDPRSIGLRLNPDGWVDIDHLLTRSTRNGIKLTRETLVHVLTASENHHFEWDQPGGRIRASTD